jgi:hypothetical protein
VWATALSLAHAGISCIIMMKTPGTPTSFMNILTASARRPDARAVFMSGTKSSDNGGRLPSTMNGASYSASLVIGTPRFAASSARAAPDDTPRTTA